MSIKHIVYNLDSKGLNLILGNNKDNKTFDSNGSAKSALFEAVTWCLYGKLLRNDTTINDIIRQGETTLYTSVLVDPEDGSTPVLFERTRNKTKTTVSATTINGVELFPSDSSNDIQKYIDNWLGLDFKAFTNSVFFGKGLTKFFMAASDEDRKDLLDTILQTISFDAALNKVKALHSETKDIIDTSDAKLSVYNSILEEKIQQYNLMQEIERKTMTNSKEELQKIEEALSTAQTNLSSRQRVISSLTEELKTLNERERELEEAFQKEKERVFNTCQLKYDKIYKDLFRDRDAALASFEAAMALRKDDIAKARNRVEVVASKINEATKLLLEEEVRLKARRKELATAKQKLYANKDITSCPVCERDIPENHFQDKINTILEEEGSLSLDFAELEKKTLAFNNGPVKEHLALIQALKNSEKVFQDDYSRDLLNIEQQCNTKVKEIKAQQTEEETRLRQAFSSSYKEHFSALKNRFSSIYEKRGELLNQNKEDELAISDLNAKKKSITEKINTTKDDLSRSLMEVKKTEENIIKLKSLLKTNYSLKEKYDFWQEAFGPKGIRSFILEASLPFLTERANYYSLFLTGGTIKINISPVTILKSGEMREKLSVSAENVYGSKVYYGNSDGERRRIDVCILLAIQDLVKSYSSREWNTLIFDEVFDTLDAAGTEHLIELLRSLENKSIFLITHSAHIKKYFDTAIVVSKQNGVSYLS